MDKKLEFIKEKGLKMFAEDFYITKELEVWRWGSKRQEWFLWMTTKFDNGDICFKMTYKNKRVKWINLQKLANKLFSTAKRLPEMDYSVLDNNSTSEYRKRYR